MCWAVQEAARSGGEGIDREFGGAQGGSRVVRMWVGVAIRVAVYYESVVSGGRW